MRLAVVVALGLWSLIGAAPSVVVAQQSPSLEELSSLRANPFSGLRSFTLQYQNNFNYPSAGHAQPLMTLQALWPFALNQDWEVITQTLVAAVSQTDDTGGNRVFGLGDTQFAALVTPQQTGTLIWGAGAALQMPTATNSNLGSDLWAAGPAFGVEVQPGNWTIGALFQNIWSFAGAGDSEVNLFSIQYNLNYNLPDGWFVESSTTATADWRTSARNSWLVPIGAGFGKVFNIGKRSVSLSTEAFYNYPRPDPSSDWSLAVAFQLLLPE